MDKILKKNNILYLESQTYAGTKWKPKEDCEFFTNRFLMKNEIVLDFDNIVNFYVIYGIIIDFFTKNNFLFWLYRSSKTGIHVHMFVNKVENRFQKKKLIEIIEKKIDLEIDKNPVMSGRVRAEDSIHPTKKTVKKLLYTNVSDIAYIHRDFYTNHLSDSLLQKVLSMSTTGVPKQLKKDYKHPFTIQFMENNKFIDGHKRIMFCLVSFYKDSGDSKDVIYSKIKKWCCYQNNIIPDVQILGSINSSTGTVRNNYRIALLKELGYHKEGYMRIKTSVVCKDL